MKRYVQIKIKQIKQGLDAVEAFNNAEQLDKTVEYIDDCIETLRQMKDKIIESHG